MAGFFKKLFNRITGKTGEPPPETPALPPPSPVPEPEPSSPHLGEDSREAAGGESVDEAAPSADFPLPSPAAPPSPIKGEGKAEKPKARAKAKAKTKVEAPKVKAKPKPEPPKATVKPPKPAPKRPEPEVEAAPKPIIVQPEPEPPPPPKPAPPPPPPPEPEPRKGWFARLKEGLSKSTKSISAPITAIFTKRKLDATTLQELEDVLIRADLGVRMAERVVAAVSAGRYDKEIDPEEVKAILAAEVAKVLKPVEVPFTFGEEKPFIILVVGVNGSGKTTTIGKLGAIARAEGFEVMLAACDTFRAAAIEQLAVWGQRIGARTVSGPQGADAAGLAFDALKEARETGTDILIVDTAGRLHNKIYLMDELDKIVRVLKKQDEAAPHAVLLVLDATTGQNAVAQAEAFTKVAGVTGLIMTKLDGSARGGILVAIAEKFKLPVHAIGVGETIDDLQPFDAEAFSRAIAGLE